MINYNRNTKTRECLINIWVLTRPVTGKMLSIGTASRRSFMSNSGFKLLAVEEFSLLTIFGDNVLL